MRDWSRSAQTHFIIRTLNLLALSRNEKNLKDKIAGFDTFNRYAMSNNFIKSSLQLKDIECNNLKSNMQLLLRNSCLYLLKFHDGVDCNPAHILELEVLVLHVVRDALWF